MRNVLLSLLLLPILGLAQTPQGGQPLAVFSEIMYNPPETNADSLEFVEIQNTSGGPLNLGGWKLENGILFTFPNVTLQANQVIVISGDSTAFLAFYGFPTLQYDQALNNSPGDTIVLRDNNNSIIQQIVYRNAAPWPTGTPSPAGGGPSIEFCYINNPNSNNNPAGWTVNTTPFTGGQFNGLVNGIQVFATPGQSCGTVVSPPNAVYAAPFSSTTVKVAFNEAVNTTAETVTNYVGLGTITSAVRNGTQDTVTLTLATPLAEGVSYTLTVDNVEDLDNTPMAAAAVFTFIFNTSTPGLIISEIMYNPPGSDDLEFIEIFNPTQTPANIGGFVLSNGVTASVPAGVTIAPQGYYYFSAGSFANSFFGLSGSNTIFTGSLDNQGETITLSNGAGQVISTVTYGVAAPWPTDANGGGSSLSLCSDDIDINNPANWGVAPTYVANNGPDAIFATIDAIGCLVNVAENAASIGIQVYPNPAETAVEVNLGELTQATMRIVNGIGQIVLTQTVANSTKIDLSTLPAGIYMLVFETNAASTVYSTKLLKK